MIEISISRELADAHPGFMAHCAERGHAVSVFGSDAPEAGLAKGPACDGPVLRGQRRGVSAIDRRAARADRSDEPEPGGGCPAIFAGLRGRRQIQPERRPSYGLRQARRRAASGISTFP